MIFWEGLCSVSSDSNRVECVVKFLCICSFIMAFVSAPCFMSSKHIA